MSDAVTERKAEGGERLEEARDVLSVLPNENVEIARVAGVVVSDGERADDGVVNAA